MKDKQTKKRFILFHKQKEGGSYLGASLTEADAAYVFSGGQLCSPEEGEPLMEYFLSFCLIFLSSYF